MTDVKLKGCVTILLSPCCHLEFHVLGDSSDTNHGIHLRTVFVNVILEAIIREHLL